MRVCVDRHVKSIMLVWTVCPKVFEVFGFSSFPLPPPAFSFVFSFSIFSWPNKDKVGKKEMLNCCKL